MQVEIIRLVWSLCLLYIAPDPAALLPPILCQHEAALDLPWTDRLAAEGIRAGVATTLLLISGIPVGGDVHRLEILGVATCRVFLLVLAALLLQTIRVQFARVGRVDRVLFAYLLPIAVTFVPSRTNPDLVTIIPGLIC